MARAKQTDRAEARRRYRQATSDDTGIEGLESEAPVADKAKPEASRSARPAQQGPARPGITAAFRAAYHPANIREDLSMLPKLLRHWSFYAPIAMIIVGAFVAFTFWNFTGGQLAWQILVFPGSGFGLPQLVAGFFAPRASYMLGFLVSLIQGVVATIFILQLSTRLGQPFPQDQIPGLLTQSFIAGPLSGTLFAAAAAWYRRFLALSSPWRAAAGGRQPARNQAKRREPSAHMVVRPATIADAESIAAIYNEGIEDRIATFETRSRTREDIEAWFDGRHPIVVAEDASGVAGFAMTSSYRPREAYAGVAEFGVYVARAQRGRGIGRDLMTALADEGAARGYWKLVSRVFVENAASRALLASVGFREVGIYRRHGQLDGAWRDVVIVERLIGAAADSGA